MRVLHVVPSFYPAVRYGGPIRSVLEMCLHLSRLGCEVRVLTTDANGEVRLTREQQHDPVLEGMDVRFCRRYGHGMISPQLGWRVFDDVNWADVIHLTAVYNFATLPTLLSVRRSGKPLVWSPRGTLQRWKGSRRVTVKTIWEGACRVVMPTSGVALHVTSEDEAAESGRRLRKASTHVIPNGVEIPPLAPPAACDGVLKLLFIGRLDPKKGIENLIAAVSGMIGQDWPKWRLRIAGDGDPEYISGLREMAARDGLRDRIEFAGHLEGEDKERTFAESDAVIVPSYTENFGMVIAEALAHARPVIASTGTPWREIQKRGCGFWVENDPGSLRSAIESIGCSDRLAMGIRGREWMIEEFSWERQARRMLSLYESLLAKNNRSQR
jgi:glycosyltransferase involved in cell wall biosynthesis